MIEFSCEAIWSWAFVLWEIFDHSFNFNACNWVVHNFYFFLVQSWKIEFFWESVHFFQVTHFIAVYLLIIVCYNPLYFCIVYCNLSFFISNFVDLILLFFSWWVWKNVCQFFSKNQLLVLLIFTIVSFISFSFICDLIFMIYFLLLTLFFCSSFSSCFRYKVRLSVWYFSCFLR